MSCIGIITGGLSAELSLALAGAGIAMTIYDAKISIDGVSYANKLKEQAQTTHEAKDAAKIMADNIAKLTIDVINVICTVAGYLKGKKKIENKAAREKALLHFDELDYKGKQELLSSMTDKELYEVVGKNSSYCWIIDDYNLITDKNIKSIVILRKDGSLNLDWPKYAGLQLETIESIGNMKGKVYVSRSGSENGKTLGYGETIDSWYVSNSKRSIPSSGSEIQVGVMDVDKYKKVIEIINTNKNDYAKINDLAKLGFSDDQASLLIQDYYSWSGERFEIFGKDGVIDGLKSINKSIDSTYGYAGNIAPWNIGDIQMEGGSGQLNTVFSWKLLKDTGIINNGGTVKIK